MENQDKDSFDKFIRKVTSENPKPPKGLEWDNMDINFSQKDEEGAVSNMDVLVKGALNQVPDIPAALDLSWGEMDIEIPKKEKKRRGFLLFFLVFFVFGMAYIGNKYMTHHKESVANKTVTQTETSIYLEENIDQVGELSKAISEDHSVIIEPIRQAQRKKLDASSSKQVGDELLLSQVVDNNNPKTRNSSDRKESRSFVIDGTTAKAAISYDNRQVPVDGATTSGILRDKLTTGGIEFQETEDRVAGSKAEVTGLENRVSPLIFAPFLKTVTDIDIDFDWILPFPSKLAITNSPDLSKIRSGVIIYSRLSANRSELVILPDSELIDRLEAKFGLSVDIGMRRHLKGGINWTAGVTYDEVHTALSFSRVLSKTKIAGRNAIEVVCEHNYRNNYHKYLGLEFGLGKQLRISDRIKLQASVSAQGRYLVSQSGFTVRNNELLNISDLDSSSDINVSLNPSLEFIYFVTPAISISTFYETNYTVINRISIDDAVELSALNQLGFGANFHF